MTTPIQPGTKISHDLKKGIQAGGMMMLIQTPLVTVFNRISVVSCRYDLSTIEAIKQIYQGKIDDAKKSFLHFFKGVHGHLLKETSRVWFKASALVLKPHADHYFGNSASGKIKADLLFAGILSFAEMLINPADTLRTMWQAGERLSHVEKKEKLSHLYKGSTANGIRQFGIWLIFPTSERMSSKAIESTTSLDPHSISGIAVKSLPQAFLITTPIWILERLKNELQYCPHLHSSGSSRYSNAFQKILKEQGAKGFSRGLMPKIWSHTILVMGADYLLEQGRKAQKANRSLA